MNTVSPPDAAPSPHQPRPPDDRLAEQAALLERLFPHGAVFVVDARRHIQYWSQGAQRLFGIHPDEVIGQHCLSANRCVQCIEGCGISQSGHVSGARIALRTASNAVITVRKHAEGFVDAQGLFAGGLELLLPEAHPEATGDSDDTPDSEHFHGLISRDGAMRAAFDIVRRVAATETTVLLRGESGTGKELLARAIHLESPRRDGPFIAINCAVLTAALLESELFGHVRGAFTGAVRDHAGVFERARGGTLFLDEIAELPLELQAKLLRVLEAREYTPVGAETLRSSDVRVVAATHRSLRREVAAGRFREDLMYRLRVLPVFLPALRSRRLDIPLLLWDFIRSHNQAGRRRIEDISPDAMRLLLAHAWPGNVRELRNVVEYAFVVGQGPMLQASDLPPEFGETHASPATEPSSNTVAHVDEAARVRRALLDHRGDVGAAAASLGMSRTTFWRRRRTLGL